MGQYSFFLFARPSFAEGAGRLLDFGNTLFEYNRSDSPQEADQHALLADWCAVGSDLESVIQRSREQQKAKANPSRISKR